MSKMPWKYVSVLSALALTACETITTTPGGETEAALCVEWGESLPTRSRSDTQQTADEIQTAYSVFAAACPDFEELIP